VNASARHMHLSRRARGPTFREGYELTVHRPALSARAVRGQGTVTLIGPRSRLISNLRILDHASRSQVELAFTDAISLGWKTYRYGFGRPGRSAGAFIMGRGDVELKEGVIRAAYTPT